MANALTQEQEDARFSTPETIEGGLAAPASGDGLLTIPEPKEDGVIAEELTEPEIKETSVMRELRAAKKRADKKAKEEEIKRKELEEELAIWKNKSNTRNKEVIQDNDNEELEEPDPEKYTDLVKYTRDLAAHHAKKAATETEKRLKEQYKKEQEKEEAKRNKEKEESNKYKRDKEHEAKIKDAQKRYEDYDDVISDADDIELQNHVEAALKDSPYTADLLYHLAKNKKLASELNDLSPGEVQRKIARIEIQIEDKRSGKKPPEVSKATPPSTPLKTVTGGGEKSIDQMVDEGDMEGIRAWQKKNPGKSW